MLKKLERNIAYYSAMAEYHGDEAKKKQDAAKEPPKEGTASNSRSTKPTASASPPKPDPDQVLHDLYTEAAKQLTPILLGASKALPTPPPIRRDEMPELKPMAGHFH